MPLRDDFYRHLADPGPESWAGITRLLDDRAVSDAQLALDLRELARELRAWPPEVARPAPRHWVDAGLLKLCRDVREVDLYPLYVSAAADAPSLRLRDGRPAARLQRSFSGSLQGAHGRMHQIGVEGQGDLVGSLVVEWCSENVAPDCVDCQEWILTGGDCDAPPPSAAPRCEAHDDWHRVAVAVEVEVKRDGGKLRPAQAARRDALRQRGEVWLLVRRTDELVRGLVAERDRILRTIRGAGPG